MASLFAQSVEEDLIARARAGDMEAHAELFRRFGGAVFTLARRLVKRHDIAEEILQETFLDVMRRIGSFRNEAPFGFWLRKIAVNRCLMQFRASASQREEPLISEPQTPDSGFESALQRADLVVLLERLPETGRAVLWLHDVEGYTHPEIGEMLGRTASFSKSQLARTHARLREMVTRETSGREESECTPVTVT